MEQTTEQAMAGELVELALRDLAAGNTDQLGAAFDELAPPQVANLLEGMPPEQRREAWGLIPEEARGEVLAHVRDEARAALISELDQAQLVGAAEQMVDQHLAGVLEELPLDLTESVLAALDQDHRQRVEAVLGYPDGSAGRLMRTNVISVRSNVTLGVVLRWLRRHSELPAHTDSLLVLASDGRYQGKLEMADLVTGHPDLPVSEVMKPGADTVRASTPAAEVSRLFERRDLVSVAVLDDADRLLGRITIDEVVTVICREADSKLLKSAGLEEDADLFAPVVPSAKRRGLWLGINLVTVFLAAWVIGLFEEALDKIVALAVLLPVVASMGGIAGSQTLTLTIRGLALDQIAASNVRWLTFKEIAVGAMNGIAWAMVVALASYLWFQNPGISAILSAAMILNLLAAALAGIAIPLVLHRMGMDPALSGAVILTTVTDVVGFASFLGLASLFLL